MNKELEKEFQNFLTILSGVFIGTVLLFIISGLFVYLVDIFVPSNNLTYFQIVLCFLTTKLSIYYLKPYK